MDNRAAIKRLTCEFLSVNAFSPNPASVSEVAALEHEVWNDTMENAALVVKRLAFLANTLFACAKSYRQKHQENKWPLCWQ